MCIRDSLTGGDLLRITPEELLRFGLRPGQELTEDVLEELRRAAARSQTRQRAAELAAGRMLSRNTRERFRIDRCRPEITAGGLPAQC